MSQLLFLLFSLYLSFSWAAKAPTARTQCHNGPIVISIDGKKENYRNFKKFETESKYYLSKAFSTEDCPYKPHDFHINLEVREKDNDPKRRCVSEIVGPELPKNKSSGSYLTRFRQVNMYHLKRPPCNTMTYPYVPGHRSAVKKSEMQRPPSPPKKNNTHTSNNQEVGSEDQSLINATICPSCTYKSSSPNVIDRIIEVGNRIDNSLKLNQKGNYTCEPQGYEQGMSKERIQQYAREGRVGELISRYSERAQPAIKRAYIALVKSDKMEKAKELTHNFESFDHLNADQLREILETESRGICYQYLKAALSGDYSILSQRKREQEQARRNYKKRKDEKFKIKNRFNESLLAKECSVGGTQSPGDLALDHWTHKPVVDKKKATYVDYSSYAAGSSGPDLEKNGFINILDSKYGVVQNYTGVDGRVDEDLLPEGAVVIYHRNDINRSKHNNFSNYRNYYDGHNDETLGDVGIKSSKGYLREYFDETPYSTSLKRVVVGVYIKPTEG